MDHGIPLGTGIAIFGGAFGAWAYVVGWGVSIIRREVAALKTEITESRRDAVEARKEVHMQMLDIEHRLTAVETDILRCVRGGGKPPDAR